MDEKFFGMFLNMSQATDKCLSGVETVMNVLIKQAKINRRQRTVNAILGSLVVCCVLNISDLLKKVQAQNKQIDELEEKIKTSKGE